jgi:hypothetical protein
MLMSANVRFRNHFDRNERPPIPMDMPREYADIIASSWATEPTARPEFSDLLPVLRDMHESLNPK